MDSFPIWSIAATTRDDRQQLIVATQITDKTVPLLADAHHTLLNDQEMVFSSNIVSWDSSIVYRIKLGDPSPVPVTYLQRIPTFVTNQNLFPTCFYPDFEIHASTIPTSNIPSFLMTAPCFAVLFTAQS